MKIDKSVIIIFGLLLAILALGLMPRYAIENALTGAAIKSSPSAVSMWNTIIVIVVIAVVVIIAFIAYFLKKQSSDFGKLASKSPATHERPRLPIKRPKTHEDRIHNYVHHSIAQGKSSSQIRHALLSVGWPKEVIEKVMKKL